jgi:hypothetical protein
MCSALFCLPCNVCYRLVAINVLMELIIAAAAVASGFSGYLSSLIKTLDDAGPHRLAGQSTLS